MNCDLQFPLKCQKVEQELKYMGAGLFCQMEFYCYNGADLSMDYSFIRSYLSFDAAAPFQAAGG